jgi:hypothetical protein
MSTISFAHPQDIARDPSDGGWRARSALGSFRHRRAIGSDRGDAWQKKRLKFQMDPLPKNDLPSRELMIEGKKSTRFKHEKVFHD